MTLIGNRVYKKSTASGSATERKYVVNITGELPVILMEIEPASGNIMKTYIYGNSEVLAQHDGDTSDDRYFYLHDRLGSVRLVIDDQSAVKNSHTYEPFGEMFATECTETIENPFKFTGQYFDSEIEEYYLRARQYNPRLARFTSRDPARGKFREPGTLQKYLYCRNNPINYSDPTGLMEWNLPTKIVAFGIGAGIAAIVGHYTGLFDAIYHEAQELGFGIDARELTGQQRSTLDEAMATMAKAIRDGRRPPGMSDDEWNQMREHFWKFYDDYSADSLQIFGSDSFGRVAGEHVPTGKLVVSDDAFAAGPVAAGFNLYAEWLHDDSVNGPGLGEQGAETGMGAFRDFLVENGLGGEFIRTKKHGW